jgi:L-ascorbate metabolism protein UlaG (beta-lactamase superfamily)
MTITKFGHCCLLIENNGKRILTDPGRFSTGQDALVDIDIVLITHEHADHCHADSLALILENNPEAIVVSNTSVAKLLQELTIDTHILEGRESATIVDVTLEAYDGPHVEIFENFGIVQNTGYMIDGDFFYPGDAYTVPDTVVDILALPVAGPWCKVSDAIRYALKVKPRLAFPVHDATLTEIGKTVTYPHFIRELKKEGIDFIMLESDTATEF